MPGWKGIVGKSFTPDEFDAYCHTLQWGSWRPSFSVLHNTAIPTLAQRPNGITQQHIQNFVSFYRDVQGWTSGPHLFIDDRQIWVFTPPVTSGTHSPSWNNVSLGVEMLGDYEQEAFDSGRGLLVQKNAVAALATLCAVLGIDPQTMRLHREDPLTTHATCPGKNVSKPAVIQAVQALLVARHPGEHVIQPGSPAPEAGTASAGASASSASSAPAATSASTAGLVADTSSTPATSLPAAADSAPAAGTTPATSPAPTTAGAVTTDPAAGGAAAPASSG